MVLYRMLRALAVTDDADVMGEGSGGSSSDGDGSGSDSDDDRSWVDRVHAEVLAMLQGAVQCEVHAILCLCWVAPSKSDLRDTAPFLPGPPLSQRSCPDLPCRRVPAGLHPAGRTLQQCSPPSLPINPGPPQSDPVCRVAGLTACCRTHMPGASLQKAGRT